MDRIPRPGEFYRDIENKLYQVMAAAEHTETGETLVVYQALYGTYPIFAMPLFRFNQKVDKKKYPRADQGYWFEPVKFLPKKSPAQEPEAEGFLDEEGDAFEEVAFEELPYEEPFYEESLYEEPLYEELPYEDPLYEDPLFEPSPMEEPSPASPLEDGKEDGSEAVEWLERFLDAEGYEKQLEVLARMRGKVGKRELDSICLVLGIPAALGDEESQMLNIKKHLETRMHYDSRRLR